MKPSAKLIWSLALAIACLAATAPKPLVPILPHKVLRSPKDAANQPMLFTLPVVMVPRVVIPPSGFTNHLTLIWSEDYSGTNAIVFTIEGRINASGQWGVLGRTTNATRFTFDSTNSTWLFRVGADWLK